MRSKEQTLRISFYRGDALTYSNKMTILMVKNLTWKS